MLPDSSAVEKTEKAEAELSGTRMSLTVILSQRLPTQTSRNAVSRPYTVDQSIWKPC